MDEYLIECNVNNLTQSQYDALEEIDDYYLDFDGIIVFNESDVQLVKQIVNTPTY